MKRPVRVTVLTGTEPHRDPWHNLDATSDAISAILAEDCAVTRVSSTAELRGALDETDVVIVNTGADLAQPEVADGGTADEADAVFALVADRGIGVLAMHSSALAFRDSPAWRDTIGCFWQLGVTMHPQIGKARAQWVDSAHPIAEGSTDFWVYDERYSHFQLDPANHPVLVHTEDGMTHPLLWTRTRGRQRAVYNALGHGVESFDSPEHAKVIRRSVSWLAA